MKEPNILKLSLLENAYDYLNCSLEFFVRARKHNSQREWKFAILNLTHGIELLLKERLRREHELLVYANLDKYKSISRETPTVTWQVLIERIKFILREDFGKIDKGRINRARELRNQMIHYDVVLLFPNVYHDYANLWNFTNEFIEKILNENLFDKIDKDLLNNFDNLEHMFSDGIVYFNGLFISKELMNEIVEEQEKTHITINGKEYARVKYGDPMEYAGLEPCIHEYPVLPCHDCQVIKGQVHVAGCDVERCPKCGGQLLFDDCVNILDEGVTHPQKSNHEQES